ncbi:MAG: Asp-tRNA(Asn)/Glu-tRNA(Gln) amidotransferase subunit GatB [Bacteroidetes bacterium]|nr:Asp-tRNA(Asn)/Glu-tRNA(Gln) amidotransferase subunit GatB [Bacteroidota bacterium]MBU1114743.1 Asp-tRNA(Asn)/Glu-tRNA(Gln) amidotransferase subunit GatB [Bacteroidota bacterium]MBU1796874.1 Asp-tRNA(Asn)/Glu-tRNA(Gln) amidotransferase subunit GatB [Bacteroidota bacterium]
MNSKYEAVIGLEVHAQLSTESKIFCGCSTKFGSAPNSNVCPICLGHPGVLPVLNKKVVEYAVLMGLATNCKIRERSTFARKNYFYPDSPKGWQTSQFDEPICENGFLEVTTSDGEKHHLRINRIHMEEDAGKSIHDKGSETLVDLNRTGVPLIEIVSEPDMRSAEEAYLYLTQLKQILTYLDICDGNMEEGSLRCDANVSIRLKGETELGTKAEVKNMNSFKNVEKAINVEIARQIDIVEDGGRIIQQTLLWDADLEDVFPMRSKEESHDYRYFPEPDLMPVLINDGWRNEIAKSLPELPEKRKNRFVTEFKLPEYDAEVLTSSRQLADYYEKVIFVTSDYKSASNWIMGEVLKVLKEDKIDITDFPLSAENLGKLIELINNNTISGQIAKDIFPEMLKTNEDPAKIVKEKNLVQITDISELEGIINTIILNNQAQVQQYLSGKESVIGFFVGQVMKASQGKANPKAVNELLKKQLDEQK